jgi:hypothetical protein
MALLTKLLRGLWTLRSAKFSTVLWQVLTTALIWFLAWCGTSTLPQRFLQILLQLQRRRHHNWFSKWSGCLITWNLVGDSQPRPNNNSWLKSSKCGLYNHWRHGFSWLTFSMALLGSSIHRNLSQPSWWTSSKAAKCNFWLAENTKEL